MPSAIRGYVLLGGRALLVASGLLVAGGTVYGLATMPAPPAGSDGFVTGLAYLFGSVVVVLGLGAASLGVVLPTAVGVDDPAGFGRGQRLLLKAAAGLIGGGLLLGLAFGFATELQFGLFLWLAFVVLGVLVVLVAIGWRSLEVAVAMAGRFARRT